MHRDSKTGLCLGEAYDWRAGRTWAAFLGSAASMALLGTLCVWVVEVGVVHILDLALPVWARVFLFIAIFAPAGLALARFADRHWLTEFTRDKEEPAGSRRFRWKREKRSGWELRADAIWYIVALLAYWIAAKTALGLPIIGKPGDSDFVLAMGIAPLVIAANFPFVSGILDRWGTRNPEAEQADG